VQIEHFSSMEGRKNRERGRKRRIEEELIDCRRGQVIELIGKGKNLSQTAEIY
jgi:hypothetical protein